MRAPLTIQKVEVGQVVFTFSCSGPTERAVRQEVEQAFHRLPQQPQTAADLPQPLAGRFAPPRLQWYDWQMEAPGTSLGWCGTFALIYPAEHLEKWQGCWWDVLAYKTFCRWLSDQVVRPTLCRGAKAAAAHAGQVLIENNPFLWTFALETEPPVLWTDEALRQHQAALIALTRVRSEDALDYTDQAAETILNNNLALTTKELQLMHYNTGFLYAARERLQRPQDSLKYVHQALIEPNAIIRAMRSCIMRFRVELDEDVACWLRQRRHRRLPRILRGLISHAAAAANLLRQVDEQIAHITQEISHRQMVFQRLLEHYRVPALADGLRQQLQQLNAQINDLHEEVQSRRLRTVNLLVLIPALYYLYRLGSELWPWLGQLPWEDWWRLFLSHG
jgi:hypothetical protein